MIAPFRFLRLASTIATVLLLIPATRADAATVVTWDNSAIATDEFGPASANDFDTGTLNFGDINANSITLIAGPGYYHDHELDRVFSMSVFVDGHWIELGNSGQTEGLSGDSPLSSIDTPIFFSSGVVTALMLTVDKPVGDGFHEMLGTQFTFDISTVPLPAALPLFGTGIGGMSLLRRWRRRRTPATPA